LPPSTKTGPSDEKTEVVHGTENVLEVVYNFLLKAKSRMDICAVAIPPREINQRINDLYYAVGERGVKLRLVTEINAENLEYLKSSSDKVQIRHVFGIGGNFAVSDTEYLATLGTAEFSPGAKLLYSNEETVVKHHQALFDALWERAVLAEQRIAEMELGIAPSQTDVIYDPSKIRNKSLELIDQARDEALLFLASSNSFVRAEKMGIIDALEKGASNRGLKVRLLTPMDSRVEDILAGRLGGGRAESPIRFQRISPRGEEQAVSVLVVDRKASLLIEKKDDSQVEFVNAVRSAIYSTNPVTIRANMLLFESLWDSASLLEKETERTSQMQSTTLGASAPAWRITAANFNCARCGKKVLNEIRIHEPRVMLEESHAVSSAMKAANAGWIPFCFECISTHRTLKPAWLVLD
jgi:two-component system, OmpR family, sensor histidine kinase VicK